MQRSILLSRLQNGKWMEGMMKWKKTMTEIETSTQMEVTNNI
jgi:hypothetical protein